MINKKAKHLLWLIPSLSIILLFTIVPLIRTIIDALINDGSININNFKSVFQDNNFLIALRNSSILTFGSIFSVGISIFVSISIAKVTNKHLKNSFISLIFLQYMFLAMAVYTGYSFIFQDNYGLINSLIIHNGGHNINFLHSQHNAIWTLLIIEIMKPISFITAIFSYRFIAYISKNKNLLKSDCISNDSLFLSKIMIKNSLGLIFLLLFYFSAENFLSYPIGIYSNDLTAMFTYHAQTLTAYINRSLDLNLFGNAAASSIIIIALMLLITSVCYTPYKIIKREKK